MGANNLDGGVDVGWLSWFGIFIARDSLEWFVSDNNFVDVFFAD